MPTPKKPTQSMFYSESEDKEKDESKNPDSPGPRGKETQFEEKQQEEYEPPKTAEGPTNLIKLPSNGKLGYPNEVSYREIMVRDTEVLSTATAETYARTLNNVLKSILNNCEFYEAISVHDRDYALIFLWANSFVSKKSVEITCSNQKCGHKETHEVDLTRCETTDLKDNFPQEGFFMPIKATGGKVQVRLNTVADEYEVESYMDNHPNADYETLMLAASIDPGVPIPYDQKLEWVRENVSGKEMGIIKKFHQYFKFGVNDMVSHTCSECKEVTRGPLPFQAEDVLFPTVSSDFEDILQSMQDS